MLKKIYTTDPERIVIINDMAETGMILIEDARHTAGNYLLFIGPEETEPYILEPSPPEPTELELLKAELDSTREAVNFLLMNTF